MLRTAFKAGVGCLPRQAASGGAAASEAGRRTLSSLQEALVKVTFVDVEVSPAAMIVGGEDCRRFARAVTPAFRTAHV